MKQKKPVVMLGIFVCLLATTYVSFSYIVTYIYDNMDPQDKFIGPLLLASNYFVFLITNSIAPALPIKIKNQLLITAVTYTINYALQMINMQQSTFGLILSVIGSGVGGFGAALLWICYGSYTKRLCEINEQQSKQGQYFALLGFITFTSSIFGPIITTFALGLFSIQIYFVILTGLGVVSIGFCYFFISDLPEESQEKHPFDCRGQFVHNCRYYSQMKSIIFTLLLDGLMLGFISSSSLKLLGPYQKQQIKVGIFLIILGAGSVLGSLASGVLSDYLKMKNVGRSSIILILFSCVFTLLALKVQILFLSYASAFIWGFNLQYIEGWIYVVCSRNFNGVLSSFANTKQLHSIAFCCYQTYLIISQDEIPLQETLLVLMIIIVPAFLLISTLPDPQQRRKAINQECDEVTDDI